MKITPREKEWSRLLKQEKIFLEKGTRKKDSKLNQILEDKVPEKLQAPSMPPLQKLLKRSSKRARAC